MKTLLTTTALLAIMAAGPALAAEGDTAPMTTDQPAATDQMAPDSGMANPPAATDQMAPDATAPAVAPDQSMTETETMAPAPADTAANTPATTDEVYIGTQAQEEDLASNWIGKSLYNGADENLGDINDILIGTDGKVRAVIVGVGGFLGIGEKDVAVSFNAIEPYTDADGNVDLRINATQEQLEAAPEFQTLADMEAGDAQGTVVVDPAAPAPAPAQ
ncbi:MAG: PRC-barrel domain-containing protein [Rhizobiales bacterium]|jgi:hypothetical protein|nr:PRC-barrel domain-containing protein [Hyphomicrobiales bacterium]